MARIIPSLFKLIGDGFVSDAYAADGNHLRWMFDPRLGFPRFAFCLERRPGMGTEQALQDVELFFQRFTEPLGSVPEILRPGLTVSRPEALLNVTAAGIGLDERPIILDFHGGPVPEEESYACWLQLQFQVSVPGSKLQAEALYDNRGEDEVVGRVNLAFPSNFGDLDLRPLDMERVANVFDEAEQILGLLRQPELGPTRPALNDIQERRLYRRLLQINQARFTLVTPRYVNLLLETLRAQGLQVNDLQQDRSVNKLVTVDLRAERIDRVALTGTRAHLQSVAWVRAEDLMDSDLWQEVNCFPIATHEEDYFERNKIHFDGLPVETLAEMRVLDPLPNGAEPMDDHQVPPSRPPDPNEHAARYLNPWINQLEPWVTAVLGESLSGDLHQSETAFSVPLTEAGQKRGAGLLPKVAAMPDKGMTIQPYDMLLAASGAFPVARLLGLAAIDRPPKLDDVDIWDYRVRGRWRVEDVGAWGLKLKRRLDELLDAALSASPANLAEAWVEYARAKFEADNALVVIDQLVSGAVGGIIELWALKVGVLATAHGLFAGPSALTAMRDGLAMPGGGSALEAVARLEWPLRQRGRVIFNEEIPLGTTIGRDPAADAGPFPEVINPTDPESGLAMAIIPAGPAEAPGDSGTAVFFDRRVGQGLDYRYGVTEADPFNRWSHFRETTFRWDYDIPPAAPVQISAVLEQTGSPPILRLIVSFSWARDLFAPQDHSFKIHLRRTAPPSASANNPVQWGRFGREPGVFAPPFTFAGDFQSNSATHDGMPATVSFSDRSETDPSGNVQLYRDYELTFDGLIVERDAIDRASVWLGVSSRDDVHSLDSAEVGGPAPASHILNTPPLPPSLPPDPELATFADAEGLSSYTLSWPGAANVRYLVYRAGEQELVNLLQERGVDTGAYDPEDEPNFRAAALKQLAPHARDAFQVRSELVPEPPRYPDDHPNPHLRGRFQEPVDWDPLPAGPRSFTDELGGYIRTLTVYAVLGKSRSGILSSWPASSASFVVVAVPSVPEPARPQVVRAVWQPPLDSPVSPPQAGAARVELLIVEPPVESAPVTSYEVYRTLDPANSRDYRLMRPLHRLETPTYDASRPGFEGTPVATYIDPTVLPWKTYYYRVVARAPGMNGGAAGMRSEASAVAQVVTLSGAPPEVPSDMAVVRTTGPERVQVSFTATAPTTSAGDFYFDLIHLDGAQRLIVTRETAANARQATPGRYLLEVDGVLIPFADSIVVRVTDPLGRSTESAPADELVPPDLDQLRARTFFSFLQVEVRSSAPIDPPAAGAFVLELLIQPPPSPTDPTPMQQRLLREALHEIGTTATFGRFVRSGPDGNGRFVYRVNISLGGIQVRIVTVKLTDPNGLESILRAEV